MKHGRITYKTMTMTTPRQQDENGGHGDGDEKDDNMTDEIMKKHGNTYGCQENMTTIQGQRQNTLSMIMLIICFTSPCTQKQNRINTAASGFSRKELIMLITYTPQIIIHLIKN